MKLPVGNTTICGQSLQSLNTVPGLAGSSAWARAGRLHNRAASEKRYSGFSVNMVSKFTY